MAVTHRIFFIPGMFGFGRLAGYEYFGHLENAIASRLWRRGMRFSLEVIPTPPTASVRKRARRVAEKVAWATGHEDDPIYLIGHSLGGLDARLLGSPSVQLDVPEAVTAWRSRLKAVLTINTPHYGTPVAHFFATVSGTRLLYALSLLTVTTLKLGGPSLTIFSSLLAALSRVDDWVGLDIRTLDQITNLAMRFVGNQGRDELNEWLQCIRTDQGGIIQATPEAMDLFNSATEDSPGVRYGCVATASPAPGAMSVVSSLRSPSAVFSTAIYSSLYAFAALPRKPYPSPKLDPALREKLRGALGADPTERSNDGIVPLMSMIWGDVIYAGAGDHLDVVGHFADDERPALHTDWLRSGSVFRRRDFSAMTDAIADFLATAMLDNTARGDTVPPPVPVPSA